MGAQILPMTLKFRQPFQPSGNQVRSVGREFHMSPGLVQLQPAPFDGEVQAGAVFLGRAPVLMRLLAPARLPS